MGIVERAIYIHLGVCLGEKDLALGGGYSELCGAEIGAQVRCFELKVFQIRLERLVGKIADHVIVGGYSVVAQQLAQAYERLHSCQTGRGDVGLELQKLEFNLEIVAFPNESGLQLGFADIDGLLKTFQVLKRELKG